MLDLIYSLLNISFIYFLIIDAYFHNILYTFLIKKINFFDNLIIKLINLCKNNLFIFIEF